MSQIVNSKCKLCRRAGEKLFLKGERCDTPKCAMIRKSYAPGMHGPKGSRGPSEYGRQLAEKQKLRRIYGVSERQLRHHLADAKKQKGVLGDNLLSRLESRFDNIVFRLGLAPSRVSARQLVSHSNFKVNNKPLNIPSALIKVGDEISVKEVKLKKTYFSNLQNILTKKKNPPSAHLNLDNKTLKAKVLAKPNKDETGISVDLAAVIEYYSR